MAFASWPSLAMADTRSLPIPPDIPVPGLEGPFVIDGELDEAGWRGAHRLTLDYEIRPGENIPPPVGTEVLIGETGRGLVLGFIAEDPEPERIRAFLRDRDEAFEDDWVGVVLDTFNDQRRAVEFFANPFGVQMDLILDDVNDSESDAWNAIWDSAGRLTDTGFVVEMFIPYRALNFQETMGELVWGIDLIRRYPRDFEYQITANPRDRSVDCYLCQLRKARGMVGAEPGRNLEIAPVMVVTGSETTDDPLTEPLVYEGTDYEPGLDVRWGITPETTLNATLNPDFSQVEADVPQLEVNNQFALFFPETRPFFLEGEDTYATTIDVIYTRNIFDPDYGLKVTGKAGPHTFGTFVADDTRTGFLVPGSQGSSFITLEAAGQNFAGRYRRDVGDLNTTVGGVLTARRSGDYHNYLGGGDARWQITESDRIRAQVLVSQTQYDQRTVVEFDQPDGTFTDLAATISYAHNERDWSAFVVYDYFGEDFRADLGFVPRVDFRKATTGGSYRWYPADGDTEPWFEEIQVNADWDITHDQSGQLLEREFEAYWSIRSRWQSFFQVGYLTRITFFEGEDFDEDRLFIYGEMEPAAGLFYSLRLAAGEAVDFANVRPADLFEIEPAINWNLGRHLQLRLGHEIRTLETRGGEEIFTAQLTDLRATWQFDLRNFIRLTAQYQDIERNPAQFDEPVDALDRSLAAQFLYAWTLNPQTVFFVGYSQSGFEDDSLPGLEVSERTAFIKASYAWFP